MFWNDKKMKFCIFSCNVCFLGSVSRCVKLRLTDHWLITQTVQQATLLLWLDVFFLQTARYSYQISIFTSKFNLSHSFPEFFLPWTPKVESWAPGRPWERCEQQEAWVTLASCLAGDEATRELLLRELARSRDGYLVQLELIPAHMAEDGGGGGRAVGASPWVLWVRWEGWTGNVCQSRISCERAETRKHAAWIPNIFRCKSLNSEASLLFSPFLNIGWISLFLVSELFQLISRRAGGRGNIWFKFLW